MKTPPLRGGVLRVACIQNSAGESVEKNLGTLRGMVGEALSKRPHIVALAENFAWRGGDGVSLTAAADKTPDILTWFKGLARKSRTHLLLGSLLEKSEQAGKFYNTSYWVAASGRISAVYRKIHLFDAVLANKVKVRESSRIAAGTLTRMVKVRGIGCGLSICYDLRFPELYRKLSREGAKLLFVPANFTYETGEAHWETLLRARAIENQCFVVAPAQSGTNPASGVRSFGSSLIVDPWGKILSSAGRSGDEVIWADLCLRSQAVIRKRLPALRHRRLDELGGAKTL
ncbi:MAG: carbon-nitrogen hydrolase family protein [Candidatus Omnitrophica bacterium]|nr:carbon-nitrogen hydrolase family protein [Candidatus Omnitrophota bacterium]